LGCGRCFLRPDPPLLPFRCRIPEFCSPPRRQFFFLEASPSEGVLFLPMAAGTGPFPHPFFQHEVSSPILGVHPRSPRLNGFPPSLWRTGRRAAPEGCAFTVSVFFYPTPIPPPGFFFPSMRLVFPHASPFLLTFPPGYSPCPPSPAFLLGFSGPEGRPSPPVEGTFLPPSIRKQQFRLRGWSFPPRTRRRGLSLWSPPEEGSPFFSSFSPVRSPRHGHRSPLLTQALCSRLPWPVPGAFFCSL